jgi:hypothetical protein
LALFEPTRNLLYFLESNQNTQSSLFGSPGVIGSIMQNDQAASPNSYPLAVAARILGISGDALRMRIHRGRAKGFKKGGRLFAVLEPDDLALAPQGAAEASPRPVKISRVGPAVEPSRPGMSYRTRRDPESGLLAKLIARIDELETLARRDRELLGALHGRIAELESLLSSVSPRSLQVSEIEKEELVLIPEAGKQPGSGPAAPAKGEDDRRSELIARLSTLGLAPEERRAAAEIVERLLGDGGGNAGKT